MNTNQGESLRSAGTDYAVMETTLWAVAVALVFGFSWLTLEHSPCIYPDEVTVTEYGRNILSHPADWSSAWSVTTDTPRVPVYWLGCVLMELACRSSHYSVVGARLVGVAGLLAAATFLLLWMRASGVGRRIALVGTTVFMLDPLLVAVSRSGRPDTLVMAFTLASCWLVRCGTTHLREERGALWRFAVAGFLAGVAPFLWPSAVFILLLVAAELLRVVLGHAGSWKSALLTAAGPWLSFCAGGVFVVVLLVLPLWNIWPEAIEQFLWLVNVAATEGKLSDGMHFISSFRVDPLLLIAVLISAGVLWKRDTIMVLAVVATTVFVMQSLVYHFRAGYALPSYYALVITACSALAVPGSGKRRKFAWLILSVLLAWNIAVSIGLRGWIAANRALADFSHLLRANAESYVGRGPYRVYDANNVFYYAGRQLGWHMFRPEIPDSYGLKPWNDDMFADFLRRVDVAIIPQPGQIWNVDRFSSDDAKVLQRAGFSKEGSFAISAPSGSRRPWWDRVLLGGGPNYGTFDVYSRPGVLGSRDKVGE